MPEDTPAKPVDQDQREQVAALLVNLASQVRADALTSFAVQWDGRNIVSLSVGLHRPLDFIALAPLETPK